MQMTGTRTIAAPPDQVYAALLNPDVLSACIPGCKEMSGSADDGFDATVTQKVGPVKATFRGHVALSDMDAPNGLTLSGEGKGGPAGFARGGAKVALAPVADGTELSYEVDAHVGGKLAQLGSRIVDAFASKMADQFFNRFQEEVGGVPVEAELAKPATAPAPTPEPIREPAMAGGDARAPEKKSWLRRIFS
ncbi:MAG: carbon monoxide dehydrogenase subunit G [Pseudomonadota bacterium]